MKFTIVRNATKPQLQQKSSARRQRLAEETAIKRVAGAPSDTTLLRDMKLVKRPISQLKKARRAIRKAEAPHIANLMKSLKVAGQAVPIIIDGDDHIINGHAIVEALRQLGEKEVWCVLLGDLSEGEAEFLQISLNKLCDGSHWVLDDLRPLLHDLGELGLDLTHTGFTLPELDIILQPPLAPSSEEADTEVPEPEEAAVSRHGDLWDAAGRHRVYCGDSTKVESYEIVLNGGRAAAVFTDCPWNQPPEVISNFGKNKHKAFKMGSGEMSEDAFAGFCSTFTQHCADHMEDGGVLYSCIDWRSDAIIVAAGNKAGLRHVNTIVWDKGVGGMGGVYRSAHELIPMFCKGKTPRVNNVKLGKHGRDRTNVWRYPGANRVGSSANKAVAHHPTPKPIEMVEDALLDVTNRGEIVLDPFLGSGTTLLAAERAGRRACGIEIDARYVDLAIRRWEEMTGLEVVHVETGLTYRELAAQREAESSEFQAAESGHVG